jgi:hypothetical protein
MRKRRQVIVLALFLGISTFSLSLFIELQFAKHETFDQINVLFHADPVIKFNSFAHGRSKTAWILAHPNLPYYFYAPIKLASKTIIFVVNGNEDAEGSLREMLALLVIPFFSTANVVAIICLLYVLNFRIFQIFMLSILNVCSFSHLIFGSIPECFLINGFFITLAYLSGVLLIRSNKVNWAAWLPLAVFGIGLTVTNVVPLVIVFLFSCYFTTHSMKSSFQKTLTLLLSALIITYTIALLGQLKTRHSLESSKMVQSTKEYSKNFIERNASNKLLSFPASIVNSLTPNHVMIIEDMEMKYDGDSEGGRFFHRFTINYHYFDIRYGVVSFIILLMILGGAFCLFRENILFRTIAVSGLMILLFNWVFHGFWGNEYFLYSQHWMSSLTLIISGIFLIDKSYRNFVSATFVVFVGFLAANNLRTLSRMMEFLEGYPF